jgi:hypothetical protein
MTGLARREAGAVLQAPEEFQGRTAIRNGVEAAPA